MGLSLAQLAKRVGCSPSALCLIENGKREPGLRLALDIFRECGGELRLPDLLID